MKVSVDKKGVLIFGGIVFIVVALCLATIVALQIQPAPTKAVISKNGEIIKTIDLSRVDQPYVFRIDGEDGYNDIAVERGRIRVVEADCPDNVCVAFGWITTTGSPIACLPHRLTITLERSADHGKIDAFTL
ncbi:MAG: NusG domain II-containing protein [Raoultibacter sp.]